MDEITKFLIANPFWLAFLFVAVVAAIIIAGTIMYNNKNSKDSEPILDCENCEVKKGFDEQKAINKEIKEALSEINTNMKLNNQVLQALFDMAIKK